MDRLWTKSFILMTVGMLFLFTGFYMLLPTLPLFIKQMGGNEAQVGLAVGVFMLSSVIFRPIVGVLLGLFNNRHFHGDYGYNPIRSPRRRLGVV